MKKYLTAALAAVLSTGVLTAATVAPASAAKYDAAASWQGKRFCADKAAGITSRKITLDNRDSAKRVQFRVVLENDPLATSPRYVWVGAGDTKKITASVRHGETMSVRIRVPENQTGRLVMSRTLGAIDSCWTPQRDPKVAVTTTCNGTDTIVTMRFDSRGSDYADDYAWTAKNSGTHGAESAGSVTVPEYKQATQVWLIPANSTANIKVTGNGNELWKDEALAARVCAS